MKVKHIGELNATLLIFTVLIMLIGAAWLFRYSPVSGTEGTLILDRWRGVLVKFPGEKDEETLQIGGHKKDIKPSAAEFLDRSKL